MKSNEKSRLQVSLLSCVMTLLDCPFGARFKTDIHVFKTDSR